MPRHPPPQDESPPLSPPPPLSPRSEARVASRSPLPLPVSLLSPPLQWQEVRWKAYAWFALLRCVLALLPLAYVTEEEFTATESAAHHVFGFQLSPFVSLQEDVAASSTPVVHLHSVFFSYVRWEGLCLAFCYGK